LGAVVAQFKKGNFGKVHSNDVDMMLEDEQDRQFRFNKLSAMDEKLQMLEANADGGSYETELMQKFAEVESHNSHQQEVIAELTEEIDEMQKLMDQDKDKVTVVTKRMSTEFQQKMR